MTPCPLTDTSLSVCLRKWEAGQPQCAEKVSYSMPDVGIEEGATLQYRQATLYPRVRSPINLLHLGAWSNTRVWHFNESE